LRIRVASTLLVVRGLAYSSAALALTFWLLPGIGVRDPWQVLLAAALLGLITVVMRWLLTAFAVILRTWGMVILGLLIPGLLFTAIVALLPGLHADGFGDALLGGWIYALIVSALSWVTGVGDRDAFLAHVLLAGRHQQQAPSSASPGMVIVQIDGMSAPLLRWGVAAGTLPTLSRWVRSGSHDVENWVALLPCTTPASQAGLLHGRIDKVPAFRWYEKGPAGKAGRLIVTNRPGDAALVEQRLSDGHGLLAGGGVSIGNIFTGDAAKAYLTVSALAAQGGLRTPDSGLTRFVASPFGFTRAVVLTIGEMFKEVYQARRQRRLGIEPRISRGGSYVLLRGVSNVLLRDLATSLVASHMLQGAPAVFCDYTDYDEIAHHAGPTRAESLRALEGIDQVLATLERVAERCSRRYEFVVLSDHGQSQGATFRQRYGETLEDLVTRLMHPRDSAGISATDVIGATGREEAVGSVFTLATAWTDEHPATRKLVRKSPEPAATEPTSLDGAAPELVVIASGNLGMIYFARQPGRLTAEEIERRYPRLLERLVTHPGVGFVVVRFQHRGSIVLGAHGRYELDTDTVEGVDPLAPFGSLAREHVRRHDLLDGVGDLVVNSLLDPATGEVAAFEELVGCHGGLGGWQTDAVLVHPAAWPLTGEPLKGADAVHRQLVAWQEAFGSRPPAGSAPAPRTGNDEARPEFPAGLTGAEISETE
jgi:uncharacterized membrane protein YvlD (DUF360 family)